jgi:hypothetical protein
MGAGHVRRDVWADRDGRVAGGGRGRDPDDLGRVVSAADGVDTGDTHPGDEFVAV